MDSGMATHGSIMVSRQSGMRCTSEDAKNGKLTSRRMMNEQRETFLKGEKA
jgi:hypothetical protein